MDERIRALARLTGQKMRGVKAEREAAMAVRRSSLTANAVCRVLDCTQTELDRWDRDGRLPHLFTKRMDFGVKVVQGRMWALEDVEAAVLKTPTWRAEDSEAKARRRASQQAQRKRG